MKRNQGKKFGEMEVTEDIHDRAVSPVLGEALLIALVIILAGVLGFMVLNIDIGGPEIPSATLEFEQTPHNATAFNITVVHQSGATLNADRITVRIMDRSGDGSDTGSFNRTMVAGETQQVTSNVESDDVVWIIWNNPTSARTDVIARYTVE